MYVRPRHAAVCNVANDGDAKSVQPAAPIENRAGIQQCLRGMLMRAVARIHNGRRQVAGEKMRCARCPMAHHDGVRTHGGKRIERIHQRFAFRNAGSRSGDGNRVRAQPFGGNLKADTRTRRSFKKQVHHHLSPQGIESFERLVLQGLKILGAIENDFNLGTFQPLNSEQTLIHIECVSLSLSHGFCGAGEGTRPTSLAASCRLSEKDTRFIV